MVFLFSRWCLAILLQTSYMFAMCVYERVHACVRGSVPIYTLMRSCTLCLQLKQQQFPMVSVLRLFRGLGLRGVQIPAARLLGEKGFLWYAPDQRWDARDPAPQGNLWPDWSSKYSSNCSDNNIPYLKSTLSISKLHGAQMWPYLELTEPLNLLTDAEVDWVALIDGFKMQIVR